MSREPGAPPFVLDTNIALDLWVFDEPAVQPLREALAAGAVWLGTSVMREELARVLAYPHLAARLADGAAADVLARWDAAVTLRPVAPKARYTCTDADDQKFIDLAAAHAPVPLGRGPGVVLVSKDKAVLRLKKRLATLGVEVVRQWTPPAPAPLPASVH
jgi:predicted nucleic acid-binding protein